MSKHHIIIIGAGPTGLATAVTLQQKGYEVTLLEAADKLCEGVSYRPETGAAYGIGHSGIYNAPGSVRKRYCQEMHERMRNPGQDNRVMQIYRHNTITTGKCITATTDEGLKSLTQDVERLEAQKQVRFHFYNNRKALASLRDPALVPGSLKALIYLPDVWLLNIKGYTYDLAREFCAKGGNLYLGHKVTRFGNTGSDAMITRLHCENGAEFTADVVVNMAGLGVAPITAMAHDAMARGGYTGPIPEEPTLRYFCMYGFTTEPAAATSSQYIIYNRENDRRALSTLGLHTYPSYKTDRGWHPVFGPISEKVDFESAIKHRKYTKEVTSDIIQQVRNIFPEADASKLRFTPLGYRSTASREGVVDFYETVIDAPGLCLINSHTSDSPGLSTSPVIAEAVTRSVAAYLAKKPHMQQKPEEEHGKHTADIIVQRAMQEGVPRARL